MKTYKVPVIRVSHLAEWIEVQAENKEEAKSKAIEVAPEILFDHEVYEEYVLDDFLQIKEVSSN